MNKEREHSLTWNFSCVDLQGPSSGSGASSCRHGIDLLPKSYFLYAWCLFCSFIVELHLFELTECKVYIPEYLVCNDSWGLSF